MKNIIISILALFAFKAQAHEFHTPNYCHSQFKNFCAHLGMHAEPTKSSNYEFVVDLVATAQDLAKVTDVKVVLWMPSMGHGTTPVKVQRLDAKHFQVTEANFIMEGLWSVNLEVMTTEGSLKLEIPLEVK